MTYLHPLKLERQDSRLTARFGLLLITLLVVIAGSLPDKAFAALAAAVLPSSRSVQVGDTATAFATIINTGPGTATGCSISPVPPVNATFLYQTTDPATNALTGSPNTPVDILDSASQTFLFAFTPTAPFAPTDVALNFDCTNTSPASSIPSVNTLLLSASSTPVPDIIALATGTGILDLPASGGGNGAFAVATVNVGSTGSITASANTGSAMLPVTLNVCETNPSTGACINPTSPAATATTTIAGGATPTFAFFATATDTIPLDPANSRAFVEFRDGGGIIRGSTSTALSSDVVSIPTVTGAYIGTASANVTGCLDPADNGSFALNATLSIPSQSGPTFGGTMTMTTTVPGATIDVLETLSGTVNSQGTMSGTMSGDVFFNGFFDGSHQGNFNSTLSGNTISGTYSVADIGDTCITTGSFNVSK